MSQDVFFLKSTKNKKDYRRVTNSRRATAMIDSGKWKSCSQEEYKKAHNKT